jgi:hypothetical protein
LSRPYFASEISFLSLDSTRQKNIAIPMQKIPAAIYAVAKNEFFPPRELLVDRKNDLVPPNVETTN